MSIYLTQKNKRKIDGKGAADKMAKLKIALIGCGQRGAGFGIIEYSEGLLGNILNNTEEVEVA